MMRLDLYNAVALASAVLASMAGARALHAPSQMRVEQVAPRPQQVARITLEDGTPGIRDASGAIAKLGHYERIASASVIADSVLWELCEPERVIAVTQQSKGSARFGHRHRSRVAIDSPAELERILALDPDLLFINHFGDPRYAARLREHGIVVFDLGEMRGVATLAPSVRAIGALLGKSEAAESLIASFERRLAAVARDIPADERPRALYLSTYGKQLYGGATGTSYDDVLRSAGLVNAAVPAYRGWPALSPEQVLSLDPEVLVTKRGMGDELCRFPGLHNLRPCRGRGRIVELDPDLVDDPGLPMLELAESLRRQVHGELSR